MSALTTRSPSRSSTILTVPWVAGCDGPICIRISGVSRSRDGSAGGRSVGTARFVGSRSGIILNRLFVVFGVVLAQRMAHEFVVEVDAAKVRMAVEADAIEVERFAFEPVGARPESAQARDHRIVLGHPALHAQAMEQAGGDQVIDDGEPRRLAARGKVDAMAPLGAFAHQVVVAIPGLGRVLKAVRLAEIIDAGDVEQQVEAELGRIAERACHFENILARDVDAVVATKAL